MFSLVFGFISVFVSLMFVFIQWSTSQHISLMFVFIQCPTSQHISSISLFIHADLSTHFISVSVFIRVDLKTHLFIWWCCPFILFSFEWCFHLIFLLYLMFVFIHLCFIWMSAHYLDSSDVFVHSSWFISCFVHSSCFIHVLFSFDVFCSFILIHLMFVHYQSQSLLQTFLL